MVWGQNGTHSANDPQMFILKLTVHLILPSSDKTGDTLYCSGGGFWSSTWLYIGIFFGSAPLDISSSTRPISFDLSTWRFKITNFQKDKNNSRKSLLLTLSYSLECKLQISSLCFIRVLCSLKVIVPFSLSKLKQSCSKYRPIWVAVRYLSSASRS